MRTFVVVSLAVSLSCGALGCGAAPGYEETTAESASLQPLQIGQPEARLLGVNGSDASFEIAVMVSNPNGAPMTMRRIDGHVFLNEQDVAHVEVDGEEIIDAGSERRFVLDLDVPVALVMQLQAETYVARGTVFADAGGGQADIQTPFELTGPVPR